jgi:beta-glucosidase
MDTSKSAGERARALLDASSFDQKLRWLAQSSANNPKETTFVTEPPPFFLPQDPNFEPETIVLPEQVPCTPTILYVDGPSSLSFVGVGTTAFPTQINLASAWDTQLAEEKGAAISREAWLRGRSVLLGPGLAGERDPRNGRTSEYLGEDPLLGGLLAGAYSTGVEKDPDTAVQSQLKHFVGNEQELDRYLSNSIIDDRSMREIYTLPVEIANDRGDVGSVMCPFNQINGDWACGNQETLTQILRNEIGFDGWVVTDNAANHSLDASVPSLRAGLDQELDNWRFFTPNKIKAQIADGRLTEGDVDTAAFHITSSLIKSGIFDNQPPAADETADIRTPESITFARDLAERGSVLLKNDEGTLPFSQQGQTIAVIGATASDTPVTVKNTLNDVVLAPRPQIDLNAEAVCSHFVPIVACDPVTPLEAITARAAQVGSTVVYNDGADPTAAAAVAADADVVIVLGYYREGEFADRPDLSLDAINTGDLRGDDLINAVADANPNTVVVLQTGGPVLMPWLSKVKSVLELWYSGEQTGNALARLLWGDVDPSGKLPITFPASVSDLPTAGSESQWPGIFADGTSTRTDEREIRQVTYSEGLQVGYRWYEAQNIEPLFEFGYGLSYTTFQYEQLSVTPASTTGTGPIDIKFRLTNTGDRSGTEVAQAYVTLPASADEPSKRLVGFQRVTLEPGQSQDVTITLTAEDIADLHLLQYWDTSTRQWTTATGEYGISAGGSIDTELTDGTFTVDVAAPTASIAVTPATPTGKSGWYRDPVTVTATATDDVDPAPVVEASLDGGPFAAVTGPIVIDEDGVRSCDRCCGERLGCRLVRKNRPDRANGQSDKAELRAQARSGSNGRHIGRGHGAVPIHSACRRPDDQHTVADVP